MRIQICKFSHNIEKWTHTHTNWAQLAKYLCALLLVLPTKTIFAMQMMTGTARGKRQKAGGSGVRRQGLSVLCGIATMRKHGTNTSGLPNVVRCVNTASILAKNSPRFALLSCIVQIPQATLPLPLCLASFSLSLSLSLSDMLIPSLALASVRMHNWSSVSEHNKKFWPQYKKTIENCKKKL